MQKQNQPNQQELNQLIQLFSISVNQCLQRTILLEQKYPQNIIIAEINAACQSLIGNYDRAIKNYYKCLELEPDNLAYINNIGWNLMKKKSNQQAVNEIKKVSEKWHHPAIYWNMTIILERVGYDPIVLDDYFNKKQNYQQFYPNYQEHKGLIHTFLLNDENNYGRKVMTFEKELIECLKLVQRLQLQPSDFAHLIPRLNRLSEKVFIRKQKQRKFGMVIQKSILITIRCFETFKMFIIDSYLEQHSRVMEKFVQEAVRLLNNVLQQITTDIEIKEFEDALIKPLEIDYIQINKKIEKFNNLIKKHEIIIKQEKQNERRVNRTEPRVNQYYIVSREDEIRRIAQSEQVLQSLTIQNGSQNPLAIILAIPNNHVIYFNRNKVLDANNNFRMQTQLSEKLSTFPQKQRKQLQIFYYSMSMLLRFYNYYGKQDIEYLQGKQSRRVILSEYMQLVNPIIESITECVEDDLQKIGDICGEIHQGVMSYIAQVTKPQQFGNLIKTLLRRILRVYEQSQNPVSELLLQILSTKRSQYLNLFLTDNKLKINGSQKYSDYFNHKMNIYHQLHPYNFKNSQFSHQDESVISKSIILLLTLIFNPRVQDDSEILVQTFVECYYSSTEREQFRGEIFEKYYEANHEIGLLEKTKIGFRKIIKKLFF